MNQTQNKRNLGEGKMMISIFFGASIGAVIGLVAYVNNWLG
ncbi:membrane protein [Lysinibacillus contaminans]|uniref:Membrane protein n=1 Tax=Lysinibacillus contaminans TaxID=1293441 RepID=A0ABR5K193_9BACI|nr:hypothetical protein [Lysinibacillus contaminans]KOS68690.1 membrane protein [Lysinibacillus contaminans]